MFLGGGIAILGSWIGALPVLATQNLTGRGSVNVVLGSAALRLAVVVLLALAAALSGAVPRAALLIWVGICYLLLLVTDSFLSANALKQSHKAHD
jgi:putative exporter of polyketide antibiotics